MKLLVPALTLLVIASFATQASAASPNPLSKVYPQGGKTLICRVAFSQSSDIHLYYIYGKSDLLNHYNCITAKSCEKNNPTLKHAITDLHNIYPGTLNAIHASRGSDYDSVPKSSTRNTTSCPYRMGYQTFEPPDYAKGNIARALAYMNDRYNLPLRTNLSRLKKWNKLDPPDASEKRRNKRIKALQGTSNQFISNPSLLDKIKPYSSAPSWMSVH